MTAFAPVGRQSLTDEVHSRLQAAILGGEVAIGERLPSERELASSLGVSRPAVREAVQRLAQAGLVRVRQGDGTIVQDPYVTGTPALLADLVAVGGRLDPAMLRSIVELRALLAPGLARLAADQADEDDLGALNAALGALEQADGPVARMDAAMSFWRLLAASTHNLAIVLLSNALHAAMEAAHDDIAGVLAPEVAQIDGFRAVVTAINGRNGSRAEASARALLRPGSVAVMAALDAQDELRR